MSYAPNHIEDEDVDTGTCGSDLDGAVCGRPAVRKYTMIWDDGLALGAVMCVNHAAEYDARQLARPKE